MTSQRNKKVRKAIQLIVDCQRHSTDFISLYEWVDLIDGTLKVMSQWGHNILIWNRQIGCMLSKHHAFAKTYHYENQRQIPMYMIDLVEEVDLFEIDMHGKTNQTIIRDYVELKDWND